MEPKPISPIRVLPCLLLIAWSLPACSDKGPSLPHDDGSAAANDLAARPADATQPADAVQPGGARDWGQFPAVVQLETAQDIYALGDVHGDYDTVTALLAGAKVVAGVPQKPALVKWSAGKAVLVCTGDLIDKWTQNLAVLDLFLALRDDAARAGGQVIVTSGNHEAEFLADPSDSNKKAAEFIAELKAAGIPTADVGAGKNQYGQFLRSLPFAARVRDWFFSHAGNTTGRTMSQLIADIQSGVDAQGWGAPVLSAADSLLEARLSGGTTPWWEKPGQDPMTVLSSYASALGAAHIVMGHQPGSFKLSAGTRPADTMYQEFGAIFFIDVGMSRGVDSSKGPLMLIHKGASKTTATAIAPDGTTKVLWEG